jgi:ApaG protein
MQWMAGSDATTRGIRVQVKSIYLADRSDPAHHHWMYAYRVTISNEGDTPARLVSRHWIITNAHGVQDHVQGPGVVGETPRLEPGETFEYTSGCPLDTAMGTMHGTYQMVNDAGERFDAEVAPFTLAEPFALN